MKLIGAIGAYVVIGLVLMWGIILAVGGNYWLLGVSALLYTIAFARIGCSTH